MTQMKNAYLSGSEHERTILWHVRGAASFFIGATEVMMRTGIYLLV